MEKILQHVVETILFYPRIEENSTSKPQKISNPYKY